MPAAKGKQDPIEKLGEMIDSKITEAFESRDRAQKEASDPWARLEGMIDRAVGKRFDAFAKESETSEKEPEKKPPEKKGDSFMKLLTGTDD